jgi:hypothetical protein
LFSRTTEIRGVTLDKSHHNFIPAVINVQNATTMDVDVDMDMVYWVDAKAKTVVRASLNGTQVETVVDSPGQYSACIIFLRKTSSRPHHHHYYFL